MLPMLKQSWFHRALSAVLWLVPLVAIPLSAERQEGVARAYIGASSSLQIDVVKPVETIPDAEGTVAMSAADLPEPDVALLDEQPDAVDDEILDDPSMDEVAMDDVEISEDSLVDSADGAIASTIDSLDDTDLPGDLDQVD